MDGSEMRARRKVLRLSQSELAERLGLSRDHVGRMERGADAILPRTAAAMRELKPDPLRQQPAAADQMERLIEQALIDAGIRYVTDQGGGNDTRLDFSLIDYDVEIEVKRFYSARTGEQMARSANVIVAQGEIAIRFLAAAIRSGDFFGIASTMNIENYRERIQASTLGKRAILVLTRPGNRGRQHLVLPQTYDTLEEADAAAREYERSNPQTKYIAPAVKGGEPGPQF